MPLTPDRAIAEIDELLRTVPSIGEFQEPNLRPESVAWTGRFIAVMRAISTHTGVNAATIAGGLRGTLTAFESRPRAVALLHEARYAQVLALPAPTSILIGAEAPYDYFEEVRKLISTAVWDLYFVDPYLDASFVSTCRTWRRA